VGNILVLFEVLYCITGVEFINRIGGRYHKVFGVEIITSEIVISSVEI
jgi:hypothetical protein